MDDPDREHDGGSVHDDGEGDGHGGGHEDDHDRGEGHGDHHDHGEPAGPVRETSPMAAFGGREVRLGLLVLVVGLAVVFGLPLVLS